jgi:hypothetical protein
MALDRASISNTINLAHINLDILTDLMATKHARGHNYDDEAIQAWRIINYIAILQNDAALTDKEVEVHLEKLIREAETFVAEYEPTTLNIVNNAPALTVTQTLGIAGTPNYLPVYNSDGGNLENSVLRQVTGALYSNISQLNLGDTATTAPSRSIQPVGTLTDIDLTITTKGGGDLTLNSGVDIIANSPLRLDGTLRFNGGTALTEFSTDVLLAGSSDTAVPTENAVKTYVDASAATVTALIPTITADNGLTKVGDNIKLGGALLANTQIDLGASAKFEIINTGLTAEFEIDSSTDTFQLFGANGGIRDNGSQLQVFDGVLFYDSDRSGSYTTRSVPDVDYVDSTIGGELVAAIVEAPTATEDGYSITWDDATSRYTLSSVSGGGGGGDADTLDGLDSTQFLRSDASDTTTGQLTIDRSAGSGASGRDMLRMTGSSDNTYVLISASRDGASALDAIRFYNVDTAASAKVQALKYESLQATGSAPFIVASTTLVTNLNADRVDGYHASVAASGTTLVARNGSGDIAANTITVVDTSEVTNLNAEMLGGRFPSVTPLNSSIVERTSGGDVVHDKIFITGAASGANITDGTSTAQLRINNSSGGTEYIQIDPKNGSTRAYFDTSSNAFEFSKAIYSAGGLVWHAGNDGAGSGLNADLLDGVEGAAFTQSSGNNILSGAWRWSSVSTDPTTLSASVRIGTDLEFIASHNSTTSEVTFDYRDPIVFRSNADVSPPYEGGPFTDTLSISSTAITAAIPIISTDDIRVSRYIEHFGDTDTYIEFITNEIKTRVGGTERLRVYSTGAWVTGTLSSTGDVVAYAT